VIGKTAVGDNTFVSTGAIIIDGGALAADSVLHGIYPKAARSPTSRNVRRDIFGVDA
jgi:serine O-acetyltransferase